MISTQKTIPKVKEKESVTALAPDRRWWTLSDEKEIAESLYSLAVEIRQDDGDRLRDDAHHARLYSNREYRDLNLAVFGEAKTISNKRRLRLNAVKAVIDSAAAKIAKNRPRPLFMTEQGKQSQQKRAEKLTQFLDGYFDIEKVYREGVRSFHRGAVYGTGVLHGYQDGYKVRVESVLPSELAVDTLDAMYGEPRRIYRYKYVPRDKLVSLLKDPTPEKKKAISEANAGENLAAYRKSGADMVKVVEAWHLPSGPIEDGKDTDGKHALVIQGHLLSIEEYRKPYFPFAFFRWSEPLAGFWGSGIPEEIDGLQIEINKTLLDISDSQHLVTIPRMMIEGEGRVSTITNEMGQQVRVAPGTNVEWQTPQGLPPETFKHLWDLWAKCFEVPGVSQMSATSKKPAGIESGVALREYNDIETERFALVGQRYEDFFLDLARIVIDLSKDLNETLKAQNKHYQIYTKQKDFLRALKWDEVDLEADAYVMRAFPTSLLPTRPEAKTEKVSEYISQGWLDKEEGMALLDMPDIKEYTSMATASLRYVSNQIELMLDKGEQQVPNPLMDLERARRMVTAKIQQAELEGYPEKRIDLLYAYLSWCDQFQRRAEMALAAQNQPPQPVQQVPAQAPTAPEQVPLAA